MKAQPQPVEYEIGRSVFRDVVSSQQLAKYSSFIAVFVIFVRSISPAIGGYFETIGWRSSFIFMMIYTVIALFALILGYQETSKNHHRDKLSLPSTPSFLANIDVDMPLSSMIELILL